jgi:hypothetical protein
MPSLAAVHALRWAAAGGAVAGNAQHRAARTALAAEAEAAVRVYQDSDLTAGGGVILARLLFDVLTSDTPPHTAIEGVIAELHPGSERDDHDTPHREAWLQSLTDCVLTWTAKEKRSYRETVEHFGNQCYLHQSLATPLAALWAHSAAGAVGQDLMQGSVRTIHSGGGGCAARSNVAGAVAGAAGGMAALPPAWRSKTTRYSAYERQVGSLVASVGKEQPSA